MAQTGKGSLVEGSETGAARDALELLDAAGRRILAEADRELRKRGLGRVHQRILLALGRGAPVSVGELRRRLGITRQALHQPVGALLREGLLARAADPKNRRIKRLSLTARGAALEARLTGSQREALARAFAKAGSGAEAAWRRVMLALIESGDAPASS
jgi:DNA-binding MarR family transcriptional regulator